MICTGLRTASCAAVQMPWGYIGRKLDLEGMRVGCVMSYITIHRWGRGGGVSLITGSSEHIWAAVQHDNRQQEPLKNSSRVFFFFLYVGGCKLAEQRSVWAWSTASAANLHWRCAYKNARQSSYVVSVCVSSAFFLCDRLIFQIIYHLKCVHAPSTHPTERRRRRQANETWKADNCRVVSTFAVNKRQISVFALDTKIAFVLWLTWLPQPMHY